MSSAKTVVGLAAAIALTAAAPAGADILPVGAWSFNEGHGAVLRDVSGHHDEGRVEGGAQWAQGRFQGGMSFEGEAAAVDVPDSRVLEPAAVTVSAWVRASGTPGRDKYVVAKGANGCLAASYGLYTGNEEGLAFYVASNQGLSWTISPAVAPPSIWNGQWHNVVGTYDGSSVRLYVDGRQVGSGTADSAPIAYGLPTSSDLMFGNYAGCLGLGYNGALDEAKVFDRALGGWEIALSYGISRLLPGGAPFDLML